MHQHGHRLERLADRIRDEVAEMVAGELKDPRIGLVTVTHVDLSPDYRHARIGVTVLGEAKAQNETLKGLESAAGYVRRELSRRLQIRRTPEVVFALDRDSQQQERVMELLDKMKSGEAEEA